MDTEQAAGPAGQSMMDLFNRGGSFMWPLLILSGVVATLAFYKLFDLVAFSVRVKALRRYLLSDGGSGNSKMLPFLKDIDPRSEEHQRILGSALQLQFDRKTRIIQWFSALGTSASMIGFIGTVAGMIGAFDAISKAEQVSVQLTAGGISEALITTGFGLIIAVAAIVIESYFRYSQTVLAQQLDGAVDMYLLRASYQ